MRPASSVPAASIKGLLIAAGNEPRLNLLSVQPIADACP
jgi:hypothetical protein